ncbi:MAG: ABC transporter substrate-binding protein [Bacillota bacterium]
MKFKVASTLKVRWLVASLLLFAMLVSVQGVIVGASPKYGGEFRFAFDRDAGTLDPASAHSSSRINVAALMFDQLVQFDDDNDVIPGLAESWSISQDGKTYTFHLRKGVKFHSGREFTADDVKYSFERLSDPKTKALGAWLLDNVVGKAEYASGKADEITGIKVVDDYTVKISLMVPEATFIRRLCTAYASIVGKEGIGKDLQMQKPVGTGPFMYVEYIPNQIIRLVRNPHFWQKGLPYLDKVTIALSIDVSVQFMRFQAGQLEWLNIMDPVSFQTICNDPRFKDSLDLCPGTMLQVLTLNMKMEPFTNPKVRQAISWAIDRERIANDVLGGMAAPAYRPLPPCAGTKINLPKSYGYDPEKAKQLLREAGYPNGFKTEIITVANEIQKRASEAIQADLAKIGIQAEVRVVEPAAYTALANAGKAPIVNMNVGCQIADPDEIFFDFLHSSRTPGLNRAVYENNQFDALVEQARRTLDENARNKLYVQAGKYIADDAPWVFLYYPHSPRVTQPYVRGVVSHQTRPDLILTKAWMDR